MKLRPMCRRSCLRCFRSSAKAKLGKTNTAPVHCRCVLAMKEACESTGGRFDLLRGIVIGFSIILVGAWICFVRPAIRVVQKPFVSGRE